MPHGKAKMTPTRSRVSYSGVKVKSGEGTSAYYAGAGSGVHRTAVQSKGKKKGSKRGY